MLVNRLREQLRIILPGAASAPAEWAFVPCPVVGFMAPAQLALAQAVYQLAAEQTREQLHEEATIRIPAFSMN
ncbi:MAG: hypothetical protein U0791_24750 [Gemmataceae bacterium]